MKNYFEEVDWFKLSLAMIVALVFIMNCMIMIHAQNESAALSDEQKASVKSILSKYNEASLTADDAKAIHGAFREAGIKGGPALNEAVREAGFDPDKLRDLDPPPARGGGGERRREPRGGNDGGDALQGGKADKGDPDKRDKKGESENGDGKKGQKGGNKYTIEQAISDRAQLNTIAFDALAFFTGNAGENTFLPPGKVSDFFGFQNMRDVDQGEMGHSTSFVPGAANNMLYVLTDAQKSQLVELGKEQAGQIQEFAKKRFPLVKAFHRLLTGDIPEGARGLDKKAVMDYSADLYKLDGLLSFRRAEVLGGIIRSLTREQRATLDSVLSGNSKSWPERGDQIDKRGFTHQVHVAVMTYASEMFSWYAGSVEADTYFCPERHCMYFGSFYMKDIPAMGNKGYVISTSLTGDSGRDFLDALDEKQKSLITGLVDMQRSDLKQIVETRRAIATELRRFMQGPSADREKVAGLSRKYGELDGEMSYFYAVNFSELYKTLTAEQKEKFMKLRNLDPKYDYKGAFIYSEKIDLPDFGDTNFLFGAK